MDLHQFLPISRLAYPVLSISCQRCREGPRFPGCPVRVRQGLRRTCVFLVRRPCYRLFFARLIELASLLLEAPALPALLFGTFRRRRRPDDGAGALLHVLGVEPVVGEQG